MNCPDDLADILLQIIYMGAVRARAAGWNNDPKQATIEADHIHNLPLLLKDYSVKKLKYYWNAERGSHITKVGGQPSFEGLWRQLEPLVQREIEAAEAH